MQSMSNYPPGVCLFYGCFYVEKDKKKMSEKTFKNCRNRHKNHRYSDIAGHCSPWYLYITNKWAYVMA